jgi:hypothetical protein
MDISMEGVDVSNIRLSLIRSREDTHKKSVFLVVGPLKI